MTKVVFKDGVFYIDGNIDELFEYKVFEGAARPLKLDFAKVRNVNSIGCREFIRFVRAEAPQGLEFHRCSAPVMDMINSIPASLGSPSRPEIVKSVVLTYHCNGCAKDEHHVLQVSPGKGRAMPDFPMLACNRCQVTMEPTIEPDDMFTYLIAED